jgi:hypothetical protein
MYLATSGFTNKGHCLATWNVERNTIESRSLTRGVLERDTIEGHLASDVLQRVTAIVVDARLALDQFQHARVRCPGLGKLWQGRQTDRDTDDSKQHHSEHSEQ